MLLSLDSEQLAGDFQASAGVKKQPGLAASTPPHFVPVRRHTDSNGDQRKLKLVVEDALMQSASPPQIALSWVASCLAYRPNPAGTVATNGTSTWLPGPSRTDFHG